MARPNLVEIVEICMVAPPPAAKLDHSSTPPNYLPLTSFDIQVLRSPRIQRLYFYESPKTTSFLDSILPRLKNALSLTLHHFLPLAGNLTWPPTSAKPVVVFAEGDAVSLTVAKSNADLYRRTGNELWEASEYYLLLPKLAVSHERAKVLAIQLTFFPESARFSIGIAANHGVVDGKSLDSFTKSWAHICRLSSHEGDSISNDQAPLLPLELKPLYDRILIKEPTEFEAIFSSNQWLNRSVLPWEPEVATDSVRGTFRLPRAKIEKLRQLIIDRDEHDHHDPPHLSAFSLTCAYTWVCLVKAEGVINNDPIKLFLPVDCRSRLNPPLATTYFGNCTGTKLVVVKREALVGTKGFVVAINAISEAIKSLNNSMNGVISEIVNRISSLTSSKTSNSQSQDKLLAGRLYTVSESNRFEVYSTDFGLGRPKKVEMLTGVWAGAMNFAESRDGDKGVEIGLTLKKHYAETFVSLFAQGLEENAT